MKAKLKKLAKLEMKKRKLVPKNKIVSGEEIIKTFRTPNKLPFLPKAFPDLTTKIRQEAAQSFFFIQGSKMNVKTDSQLREVLQKKKDSAVVVGGIVSGYSKNGRRILLEFPQTLHAIGTLHTDIEIIDSHLWISLDEFTGLPDQEIRTVSLGDFVILAGTPTKYYSRGNEKYSLKNWGVVRSGLLASREGETLDIKEDYLRVGWIFKIEKLPDDQNQGIGTIQELHQIKKDEQQLIQIFKDKISFQTKGTNH